MKRRVLLFCGVTLAVMPLFSAEPAATGTAPALASASPAVAQPAAVVDKDLPQPFDAKEAETLLTHSPFTRALNLSDSLVLTGVAYLEGRPVATVMNKATKESHVVSEEPNVLGWKLAEINASRVLNRTEIKITVDGETVSVRYSDDQLLPKNTRPGGGGFRGPGGPGGPPGPDGQRFRTSSLLGDNGRDRYMALSDTARDKFREMVRVKREAQPNASQEELTNFAKKEFDRIEADDKRSRERGGR
ncbi:MAG: hypothetical protein ACAI34_04035 [Verrucomicrobium sp.]